MKDSSSCDVAHASDVTMVEKKEWVAPQLVMLDAGNDTENNAGPGADSFGRS